MVIEEFGPETWDTIREKAGMEDEIFISNQGYPDEVTYTLVTVASEVLDEPVDTILEQFGIYWVMKVAKVEYGELMTSHGIGLGEFLDHLPNFHSRLEMIFPNFNPPRFKVAKRQDSSLELYYYTHREGLARFVVGIIRGLGQLYETEVSVDHIVSRADTGDHDVYSISWAD